MLYQDFMAWKILFSIYVACDVQIPVLGWVVGNFEWLLSFVSVHLVRQDYHASRLSFTFSGMGNDKVITNSRVGKGPACSTPRMLAG